MEFALDNELILSLICSHLTHKYIANAVLVSKAWSRSFSPRLWHTVQILTSRNFYYLDAAEGRQGIARNDHHIRTLCLNYYSALRPFAAADYHVCTELRKIVLLPFMTWQEPSRPVGLGTFGSKNVNGGTKASSLEVDYLTPLMDRNPGLLELQMPGCAVHQMDQALLSLPKLKNLQTLKLHSSTFFPQLTTQGMFLELLFDLLPIQLKELQLALPTPRAFTSTGYFPPTGLQAANDGTAGAMETGAGSLSTVGLERALQRLCILDLPDQTAEAKLFPFLDQCPNLQSIQLPYTGLTDALAATLQMSCPRLRVLELKKVLGNSTDEEIAVLVKSCSGLTNVLIQDSWLCGDRAMEAILEHAGTLEGFVTSGCPLLKSKHLDKILRSCPRLRTVASVTDSPSWGVPIVSDVADLSRLQSVKETTIPELWIPGLTSNVATPWACFQSLTILRLTIEWIQPSSIGRIVPNSTPEREETEREVWKTVYTQLGALTRLQELVLKNKPTETSGGGGLRGLHQIVKPLVTRGSLDMTLKSGLGEMSGLKELWLLDVYSLCHKIRKAEIAWMKLHWPRLQVLKGWVVDGDEMLDVLHGFKWVKNSRASGF